eukprot:TRINITY_DN2334_c0_g1_i2.p1 TRINITY_DN2334_c0_g1~~TRINITY_DN2334_c0_g1_i2.p1  ORF type:complete len:141 (-),score=28.52 TRINITY_DN2334_c0_g1_i2:111-533(-)
MRKVFDRFDMNGNGKLSLAEIDKGVGELYPDLFQDKRAMMRAYKAVDANKDGLISFKEFEQLLDFLYYFNALGKQFASIDLDHDHRVTLEEFKKGARKIGLVDSDADIEGQFHLIDTNHGGYIMFDEFCEHMAKKQADVK